jgi:hypothetical protein
VAVVEMSLGRGGGEGGRSSHVVTAPAEAEPEPRRMDLGENACMWSGARFAGADRRRGEPTAEG